MSAQESPIPFTETHHALLFGWIAKEILTTAGEQDGEEIIRGAVRQYGQERGHRMALRALAGGQPLSMAVYRLYGEWQPTPGLQHAQREVERTPALKVHILQCPWHQAWKAHDLLPYARFYCLEVDKALVHGFNPELTLGVNGTLSNGAEQCEFVYHGLSLPPENAALPGDGHPTKPAKPAAMPWEYHLGHLFATFERVAVEALGEAGREAVRAGLEQFGRQFGEPAAQRVAAYREVDFDQLP